MKACLFIILVFLLSASCSRSTKVIHGESNSRIEFIPSGIEDAHDIPWHVGKPERETQISKGIRLEIALPDLSSSELSEFHKRYQVDSWIGRIGRLQQGRRSYLAHFYIPLLYQREGNLNERNVSSGSVQILYADAAPSKRFSDFPCPAFGHRLKINDTTVNKGDSVSLSITGSRSKPFGANPVKLEFGALTFNGGKTLEGLYWAELAYYNSQKALLLSDFTLLSGTLEIGPEESVAVNGCSGFAIPDKEEESTKNFKFGQ